MRYVRYEVRTYHIDDTFSGSELKYTYEIFSTKKEALSHISLLELHSTKEQLIWLCKVKVFSNKEVVKKRWLVPVEVK